MECQVCYTDTCSSACPYCSYGVCTKCTRRYLLDLTTRAKCMNCSKLWNRENIEAICGNAFLNGVYNKRREELLFEQEKALFPATQHLVKQKIECEKTRKLILETMRYMRENRVTPTHPEYQFYHGSLIQLYDRDRLVRREKPPKKIPTHKCPCVDCKGFLKKWKCQMCETHICKRCNEPLESAAHTCDPGAVETMKLLRKDTKGCPSCGCMISKISGCSQMWCTECHTTFDWNTLQIETGVLHNPHYFEYMRRNGGLPRQPGDPGGACHRVNGLPTVGEIMSTITFLTREEYLAVEEEARKVFDVHDNSLRRIPPPFRRGQTLESLRVSYMMNRTTEDQYRFLLQKNEKYREKIQDLTQVRDMYTSVFGDLIRSLLDNKQYPEFKESLETLKGYTNEAFAKLASRYKCVVISV